MKCSDFSRKMGKKAITVTKQPCSNGNSLEWEKGHPVGRGYAVLVFLLVLLNIGDSLRRKEKSK